MEWVGEFEELDIQQLLGVQIVRIVNDGVFRLRVLDQIQHTARDESIAVVLVLDGQVPRLLHGQISCVQLAH